MAFELTVGESRLHPPSRVTHSLYDLVSVVLHREFDFPLLTRLFSFGNGTADAAELMREAEILKDAATAHTRPFVDVGRPLDLFELEGMLRFPVLLKHEGQIVTDWTEIVSKAEGSVVMSQPPTLLASREKLHLVDAVATEVAATQDWSALRHISAQEFRWEASTLFADTLPQVDVPMHYTRPWLKHTVLRCTRVRLYDAWQDEIESLIDVCREGIRLGQSILVHS